MKNLVLSAYVKSKNALSKLKNEEKGASEVIAIVIILGIVVALAFLFGQKILDLFNQLWEKVTGNVPKA